MSFSELLQRVATGENLSRDEMSVAIGQLMQGEIAEADMGSFLLALRAKGETVDEIAGAATAMRRHMTPIRSTRAGLLDTCGTGGDASGTFNISTAAALVTAAVGVPVAKHGNRSITSKSGSADVLAALGVNVDAPVERVERCLQEIGICFCFAPRMHPAMKHVAVVRRSLGVPTIFNMLGPLCNPAGAPYQLLGVGRADLHHKLAAALQLLGTRRAAVVRGDDGLDEVTLAGPSHVLLVSDGQVTPQTWTPTDFGLPTVGSLDGLRVDGPEASADVVRSVLAGQHGPARDIVVLNAAAGLWIAGFHASRGECASAAAAAIDSGAALKTLERLVRGTRETPIA